MATSLAAQLQKLAVPQTSLLQRDKRRASLLFDPKEAAAIDKDTFYDIGISGLRELQKYNAEFTIFENNLFSSTSRNIERAVESKQANSKLNKNIKKFLMLLSPYFLLKPAHKALEWLIYRFYIHEYNRELFFELIFPYHETNMFARCLQLFKLNNENDDWHWLKPLQKPGIHLPKLTLFNHCASDVGFLKFISKMVFDAVKENGAKANSLTTLFTFYCTTTIGALEHSKEISEPQISAILPPLLKGLLSEIPDFTASAYMITAQLLKKTKLSDKILEGLIIKISSDSQKNLRMEATLLLLLIYQSQQDNYSVMQNNAIRNLVSDTWFPVNLGKLSLGGSYVLPILIPVLKSALKFSKIETYRKFVENLITEIRLNDSGAELLIKIVLDNCPSSDEPLDESIDLDEYGPVSEVSVTEWLGNFLKRLETQYPIAFDKVVREVMTTNTSKKHRKALRSIMNFMMSDKNIKNITIFEKLYHPNSTLRANAVQFLVKNFSDLSAKDLEMLEGAINERLLDDDQKVVHAVLQLEKNDLIKLLGQDRFITSLLKVLTKCIKNSNWSSIAEKVFKIICTGEYSKDTRILLAILPFLFPINDSEVPLSQKIIKSDFANNYKFLLRAKSEIKHGFSSKKFCTAMYKALVNNSNEKDINNLLEDIKSFPEMHEIHKYLLAILSAVSLPLKCPANLGVTALQCITPYFGIARVSSLKNKDDTKFSVQDCIKESREGNLPLDGLLKCLSIVINRINYTKIHKTWLNLLNPDDTVMFLVNTLTILLKGCNHNNKQIVKHFSEVLKIFLDKFFNDFQHKINFLANFIASDDLTHLKINSEMQLIILNVLNSLLIQSKDPLNCFVNLNSNILVPAALIGLINPLQEVRILSMEILSKLINCSPNTKTYIPLLQKIVNHKEEILLDSKQLPLILFTITSDDSSKEMKDIINTLFKLTIDTSLPINVNSLMLKNLTFINSYEIFETISKLGTHILKSENNSNIILDPYKSSAFYNIIIRLTETTAKDITLNSSTWELLSTGLKHDIISLEYEPNKYSCPTVLILDQITREVFANFNLDVQSALIKLLIEIATVAENPTAVSAATKVIKKIDLNAKLLVESLTKMKDVKSGKTVQRKFRQVREIPTADILDMIEWKEGITALEFIQDKKKLTNVNLLLPIFFEILKKCLDFDEQSSVEYPKQILLSAILHCCNKMKSEGEQLPANVFNMELVVQCIRASQNPQTHHHALLVLAYTASLIPTQVLHNIMAIFTFMGSSVLRHDDAYSFQIISKIIDTVIPILVQDKSKELETNVASVLRVFVDAILDIPEHRRMPLFKKLLITLGVEEYMWIFLLLIFESHVIHGTGPKPKENTSRLLADVEPIPKRLDIAANITLEFSPEIIMKTSIKLLDYLKDLPTEKDDNLMEIDAHTFNIKQHTPKQFRHYKYTIATFMSNLLSSKHLVNTIAVMNNKETVELEPYYKNMIISTLTYIQSVSKTVDKMSATPQAQYWKVMLHHCYDIMDSINALLTTEMFLLVIRGLITHNIPTVRRKAMELLNTKLQYQPSFFYTNPEDTEITETEELFAIVPSLLGIIKIIDGKDNEPEYELTQQTALLSLKLLVKLLAAKYPDKFVPILDYTTELIKSDKMQGNILASVVLCLAELCSKLRAHAIPGLVKYMPAIIKVLKIQKHQETPGLLLMCTITAIQKIVESLPLFLSPYLEKLLCELSVLSAKWCDEDDNQKLSPFLKKLDGIRSNIGTVIPPRILIPLIAQSYNTLLTGKEYKAIGPLMNVLSENLSTLRGSELTPYLPDLTTFFLKSLQFRDEQESVIQSETINLVEDHLVKSLITLVLKLSETTFRPFYYRLFDWAVRSESKSEKVITFYRLSCGIAENLKGLFVLFAGHFVKNASSLLDSCNQIKNESLYFEQDEKNILLIESILKTMNAVFLYDSQKFVDKDKFETLMQPIVDQLENPVGGLEQLTNRATDLIIPCLAQFAVATADDALWKQLNYQILLKTRHNLPEVRLIALNCLCEVTRKLGEDFLPLLPETIPFLAELLEDEEETVESACQKVVQDMEKILGEPLQKYF